MGNSLRRSSFLLASIVGWALCGVVGCTWDARTTAPEVSGPESSIESLAALTPAAPFRLLVWNVNSGVERPPAERVEAIVQLLEEQGGADFYALSEVHPQWVRPLTRAIETINEDAAFDVTLGESGRAQRLLIAVNTERFRPLEVNELGRINADGYGRAPLAALLEDRVTGQSLFVVNVHLRRGNGDARREEARALRALVEELEYDSLLVGDFNMDCDADVPQTRGCNDAFGALMDGSDLVWRPHRSREATHCSRSRYNSILDYVFAAGGATRWSIDVEALDRNTYCTEAIGDGAHVPLEATVTPGRQ
jgi:endonuclease/exonuclease/phosphatase family metal-dependent hydrolase